MSKLRDLSQRIPPMGMNALKFVGVLACIALGLFAAVKAAGLVIPFIVAFVLASLVEPLVRVLGKRLHLSRGVATMSAVLLVMAVLIVLLSLLGVRLFAEARDFAVKLPAMFSDGAANFDAFIQGLDARYEFIDEGAIATINQAIDQVKDALVTQVNQITRSAIASATSLPRMIVSVIVTLLATFFIVRDRSRISREVHRQLPERWIRGATSVKNDLFGALFGYVRALLILMCITFVELSIGFSLVGVRYAMLFAAIIALLDALPVLGTGTFVVPWSVYTIATGDVRTGVGLLLVFCFVWVVRQLLEPRIVGDQIGIHPLLTLISMYIGMRYMGVFGMILGPIALIVVRNLLNVYTRGRTLREMLYEGIPMPEEDAVKDVEPDDEAARRSLSDRIMDRIEQFLRKRFGGKK